MTFSLAATIGRLYPFYSGNFSAINSRYARKFIKFRDRLEWCRSPGGELLVPLFDEVGRCIFYTGDYDRKLTWLCRKLVRSGDVAIDVGANLGVLTMTLSSIVGEYGIVHAFEPNPYLQGLLRQVLKRNCCSNIMLHPFALGSRQEEINLFVPKTNLGQGSLVYRDDNLASENYPCLVRPLDEVAREQCISSVALLKIDVEGFEKEVLLGASHVLSRIRPRCLLVEVNEQNQPPFRDREVFKILHAADYSFLAIPKALFSMRAVAFDPWTVDDPGHDVIAVANEHYAAVAKLLDA